MKLSRAWLGTLMLTAAFAASAQWQWIDKDGRRVFSDRPPPNDVPVRNIIRQPGAKSDLTAPPATTAAPAADATAPRPSGKDRELDDKKKQADAAQAEKRRLEQERHAAERAEYCERVRRNKAGLDAGTRLARPNDKGELEYLDDSTRAAESRRMEAILATECQ